MDKKLVPGTIVQYAPGTTKLYGFCTCPPSITGQTNIDIDCPFHGWVRQPCSCLPETGLDEKCLIHGKKEQRGKFMEYSEAVKKVFDERKELFVAKNANYGNSWIKTGKILEIIFSENLAKLDNWEDHAAFGVLIRMLDKIVRYSHIRFTGEKDKVGESLSDTIGDLGTYALMCAAMEKKNEK